MSQGSWQGAVASAHSGRRSGFRCGDRLAGAADGRVLTTHIEHCRGSQTRPMSNADLSEKFLGQAAIGYRADHSDALLAEVWRIREVAMVGASIRRWFDES